MNFKRYLILITKDGMDAAIQISDNPEAAVNASKRLKPEYFENRAHIILLFKNNREPNEYLIKSLAKELKIDAIVKAGGGGATPQEYAGIEFRRNITNGILIQIALEEKWFKQFRQIDNYKSAFYLLDIMINGKTNYGRFGEPNKSIIFGQNVFKDKSEEKIKIYKKLRREMLNKIEEEEDPEVI